jgi:hypothetical protein
MVLVEDLYKGRISWLVWNIVSYSTWFLMIGQFFKNIEKLKSGEVIKIDTGNQCPEYGLSNVC